MKKLGVIKGNEKETLDTLVLQLSEDEFEQFLEYTKGFRSVLFVPKSNNEIDPDKLKNYNFGDEPDIWCDIAKTPEDVLLFAEVVDHTEGGGLLV